MVEHAPKALVVDDEEHITELLKMGLSMSGFEVERAATGRGALDAIEKNRPDIVVLDVMLPDLSGFDVIKRLRQTEGAGARIPIIFLTARDTTADKIEGLRLGSDDYMTKPFSIEELIERVKAVLRRSSGALPGSERLLFADLEMDLSTRDVWRAGRFIELTPTEYKLLHYLLANARRVLTRDQNPRARVGVHLLRQRQRARDLHQLPPPEGRLDRPSPNPHCPGRGLQPEAPARPVIRPGRAGCRWLRPLGRPRP